MSATPQSALGAQPCVLQLGPYPPPHGGVEVNLVSIRDFLRRRKIPCDVINLTRHRRPNGDGVYYPRSAWEAILSVSRSRARVLHLHIGGNVTWRLLLLGLACSLLPGKRIVLTLHSGGYPSSPAARSARPMSLRGFLFRRFDGLIGVNQEIVEMFVRFGVPRARTRVIIPFALSFSDTGVPLPPNIRTFFDSHDPVIVSVSGLEPEYDVSIQINALGEIVKTAPKAGLLICGTGSLEQELRQAASARSYADSVLLAGDLPHDVVLHTISQADAFVRTTHYDGDSIAVREALHFGVPTIVTDTGMRPAGVRLIPVGDSAALVDGLRSVLSSAKRYGIHDFPESVPRDDSHLIEVLELYEKLSGGRLMPEGTGKDDRLAPTQPSLDLDLERVPEDASRRVP